MDRLIFGITVGYMLKVLKSGKDLRQFRGEFNAIRHGDYLTFIKLIDGPMPYIARYENDMIFSGFLPPLIDDIDFELLIKAGPSLKIFLKRCLETFGPINDSDLNDEIFEQLALFEITLRVHAKNENLIKSEDKLNYVIDAIGKSRSIPSEDIYMIHQGRRFLNMIKHGNEYFRTWNEGLTAFDNSLKMLVKYNLGW